MSLRFPTVRPETEEIVEPDDLNQNLKQFVDEINGNLTHENLSNFDIPAARFANETFSEVFQSSLESTTSWDVEDSGFVCSKETTGFIRVDKNDKKMPLINFVAERDGWIIVDFSAAVLWKGTGLIDEEEAKRVLHVKPHYPLVDHREKYWGHKSTLPPGGWLGIVGKPDSGISEDDVTVDHQPEIHYLQEFTVGSDTGTYADFPQGKWLNQPVDRFAVKLRVLSNGVEVCESGWIYNGTDRNGIYLTGVIPVRAGRNEIRTEVSAGMMQSIYGVSQGVRAKDSDGKKGEFIPNSFFSSRDVSTPLPKSFTENISIPVYDDPQATSKQSTTEWTINYGMDCTVQSANLVIQYRKA